MRPHQSKRSGYSTMASPSHRHADASVEIRTLLLRRGVPDRRNRGDTLLVGGADGHEPVRVDDPPCDRPELFAFRRHILERPASASCNERTTSAPSPTADA